MMNQGRNNPEREDGYQNTGHVSRAFQNRPNNNALQIHPNLNPNYQNPVDLIRNYNRRLQQPQQQQQQQQHEPEENIYERLDNDDDEDDDENAEIPRNELLAQNNQGNADNHAYERINGRISCSNKAHCRYYKYHGLNNAHSFLNDMEGARNASQYDQPRHIYIDYSRLNSNLYRSSLSRLGRNCFSTENIAYASTKRSIQPYAYNCTCPYCRHADARYICHHCQNLHNRLRYQDAANSRHYVYQVSRNCRCPFCRGEYSYAKLPANALRAAELLKMECCHCRNPANCTCRGKMPTDSNSAIYIGRYLDWINRTGQSVNNPLYATIHVSRIDRASMPGHVNASNGADPGPSTSNGATSNARHSDSNSSSMLRSVFASTSGASTSNAAAICPVNRYAERQHTCDDSCIRSQSGNVAGICQLLGRCERTECNHGRLSVHWWFVNKWLPLWNSHNLDRNTDGASCVDEVSREQRESDSDDS
ncbi:uncharacterized protein [Linepithema humile]|uniref:uncharacterized protein n=1 Tax=Linepithema humile TaxID=83485 RepID=UPI00351F566C